MKVSKRRDGAEFVFEFRPRRTLVGVDLMLFGRMSGVSVSILEPLLTLLEPEQYSVYQLFDDVLFGTVAVRRSLLALSPLEAILEAAREELRPVVESEGYWAGDVTVRPVSGKTESGPAPTEPQAQGPSSS